MAKKNSTKTATKEALAASEPRLQVFTGWQGINIEEAPLGWSYTTVADQPSYQNNPIGQTDLLPNYLTVQNNVCTTSNGTLETRDAGGELTAGLSGCTGVTYLKNNILYAVHNSGKNISYIDIVNNPNAWQLIEGLTPSVGTWTDIYSYCSDGVDTLICLCSGSGMDSETLCTMYTAPLTAEGKPVSTPQPQSYIPTPPGLSLRVDDIGFTLANNVTDVYAARPEYQVWTEQILSSAAVWSTCTQQNFIINFSVDNAPTASGDVWLLSQWDSPVNYSKYGKCKIEDFTVDLDFSRKYDKESKEYTDWKFVSGSKVEYFKDSTADTNYTRVKNKVPILRNSVADSPSFYTQRTLSGAIGDGEFNVDSVNAVSLSNVSEPFKLDPYRTSFTSSNFGGYIPGNITDAADAITMVPQCLKDTRLYNQMPMHYYRETLTSATFSKYDDGTEDTKTSQTRNYKCSSAKFHSSYTACTTQQGTSTHATSVWFLDSHGHLFCFSYEIDALYPSFNYSNKLPHTNGCGCVHMYVMTPPESMTGGKSSSVYFNAGSTTEAATYYYTLVNKYGSTKLSTVYSYYNTVNMNLTPLIYTEHRHLQFRLLKSTLDAYPEVVAVNFYCISGESTEPVLCKSVSVADMKTATITVGGNEYYCMDYYGALENTDTWFNSGLSAPQENTTTGPAAGRVTAIDSRLYFWGNVDKPYQLTIGGRSKLELYHDTSFGGGYVQCDPGTGVVVHHVCKFKTASGANIVTILCGSKNSTQTKRYNLIEDAITLTSELETTGWSVEHVSNVVGCNSDYGAVVCADGIYVLDAQGLMVTTQQMEYSNQLQSRSVSDAIKPVFVDKTCASIITTQAASMVYLDNKLYFHLGHENSGAENIIYVYDLSTKAWYTHTIPYTPLRMFVVDTVQRKLALGIVYASGIYYIPVAKNDTLVYARVVTSELTSRQPTQGYTHVSQLEFRFDYIRTDANGLTITIRGVDVYGRRVEVTKTLTYEQMAYDAVDWIRMDYKLENYHITFSGNANYRMTHVLGRVFVTSSKINEQYGWDSISQYYKRGSSTAIDGHDHGGDTTLPVWQVPNYNNFKECVIA